MRAASAIVALLVAGRTAPSSSRELPSLPGVKVPMGVNQPTMATVPSSLLYNEFIVYDVKQVQQRYLLQVRFKYTSGAW